MVYPENELVGHRTKAGETAGAEPKGKRIQVALGLLEDAVGNLAGLLGEMDGAEGEKQAARSAAPIHPLSVLLDGLEEDLMRRANEIAHLTAEIRGRLF